MIPTKTAFRKWLVAHPKIKLKPSHPNYCALAQWLGCTVGVRSNTLGTTYTILGEPAPKWAQTFAAAFDKSQRVHVTGADALTILDASSTSQR